MLPLRGQRRALCSLASQLSAGISGRQVQRCSANHQVAAPVAALADKVQHASQVLHALLGPGGHRHENCRTSWTAEQMRPWQQGQKNDQHQATILAASLPFISRHISPMAFSTLPLQLSAMRMAHSSAGPETRSDLRRGTHDSRRFSWSALHTHRSSSRVSGAVRHSSNDGSSGPDGYSKTSEPPGSPGKHSLESPTAWRPAGRPESGPLRQDTQPVRQQAGFQRSQTFQLNGPGTRPPPPGYQRPAAWWQPPPAHQPRSPPGPPLSRPPLQPLNRDPFPPPPVSEEALLPDDAEIRLVREDKSHEVLTYRKAMREAQRAGLDLIGVALTTQPPVFRLGNADKAAHAARQREKELRRKEVETRRKHTVKEVRIGPTVAEHDLQVKLKQARAFVEKKYRVKLFVPYRMQQRQDAFNMLGRLRELGGEFAAVANPAVNERLARNTYAIFLSPK